MIEHVKMSDSESLYNSDDDIISVDWEESNSDGYDLRMDDFELPDFASFPYDFPYDTGEMDTTLEAGAPPHDEVDFLQPVPNWEENAIVEAREKYSSFPEVWSKRNNYLGEYASAVRGEKQHKQDTMRRLLQYSPETVDKVLDRKLRQSMKTEDMEQTRKFYTPKSDVRDVMGKGANMIAKHVLRHSHGQKYLNDDVIDKILRYIDRDMSLRGVPVNINGPRPNFQDAYATGLELAALGSRDIWKQREYLHPMYRQPYSPLLEPDEPRSPAELAAIAKEYRDRRNPEEWARRAVYSTVANQSSHLVDLINSYM
jgi:hypothetical protein